MLSPVFAHSDPSLLYQYVNLTTAGGVSAIPLQALDEFQHSRMMYAAMFGARASTSAVISLILFLIVERKNTPVYFFNQISLILFFIQSTLFLVHTFGPFGAISTVFTGSYAAIHQSNIDISVASSVFQLLFIISIQISLFFQGRVVFPKNSKSRLLATIILALISLATVILYTLYIARNVAQAIDPSGKVLFPGHFGNRLPSIAQIMFAASISFCTLIFVGKLIFAIRTRWVLGLKQFGPLQIICIMGGQSMIVPAVITIISFARPDVKTIYAVAPLVVVMSLPLSAMWAQSANTSSSSSKSFFRGHQKQKSSSKNWYKKRNGPSYDVEKQSAASPADTSKGFFHQLKSIVLSIFASDSSGPDRRFTPRRMNSSGMRSHTSNNSILEFAHGEHPRGTEAYMSRNSFEAQTPPYQNQFKMNTRVSIGNIDALSMDSQDSAHGGPKRGQVTYLPQATTPGEAKGDGETSPRSGGHSSVHMI